MKDILEEIVANKKKELEERKSIFSIGLLEENCTKTKRKALSMSSALSSSTSGIIAEFKRRSPSKGWINEKANIADVTSSYERNGASALSILTDNKYFGGKIDDIITVRPNINIPILRKEFIIDEYQIYQARLIGADAILLIAAALEKDNCMALAKKAHELGLEVLLELHSEPELDYINDSVDMIGINNRNLGTFHTDVSASLSLIDKLPKGKVLVSESGISSPNVVKELREKGFNGFLIGERFMKDSNPGIQLAEFINAI